MDPTEKVKARTLAKGKSVQIGTSMSAEVEKAIIQVMIINQASFTGKPEDISGININVNTHKLNVDPAYKPIIQKLGRHAPDRNKFISEEVDRLLKARTIGEVDYPEWLTNVVLIKKSGKLQMCVDFTDLKKICLKDSYPLPSIDQLMDATASHAIYSLLDTYVRYH